MNGFIPSLSVFRISKFARNVQINTINMENKKKIRLTHLGKLIILIGGAFILLLILNPNIFWIKILGLLFQLLGISFLYISLKKTFELYSGSSLLALFKILQPITVSAEMTNAPQTCEAKVSTKDVKEFKEPEHEFGDIIRYFNERFEKLEKRVTNKDANNQESIINLEDRQNKIVDSINNRIRDLESKSHEELQLRMPWELASIFLLPFGIFLSTFPEIIGCLCGFLKGFIV